MFQRLTIPFAVVILCGCNNSNEQQKVAVNKGQQDGKAVPDAEKKEDALPRGSWKCIAMEVKGEKYVKPAYDGMTLTTDGNIWAITHFGVTSKIKVKLDEAKEPKEVDLYYERAGEDSPPLVGIYKLNGDELTLCRALRAGSRPKEFLTNKEGGTMMVFRRVAK